MQTPSDAECATDPQGYTLGDLEEFHEFDATNETSFKRSLLLPGSTVRCDQRFIIMLHRLILAGVFPRDVVVLIPDPNNSPHAVGYSEYNPYSLDDCGVCSYCNNWRERDPAGSPYVCVDQMHHDTRAISMTAIEPENTECFGCRHDHSECEYRIECFRLNEDAIQKAWNNNARILSEIELPVNRVIYAFPSGYGWKRVSIIGSDLYMDFW